MPNISLFIYMYVRKEAVLSSRIEGTQSTLSDLLMYENHQVPGVSLEDVQEVSNYVAGLNHGIKRIRGGFPLCLRLLKEIHEILLSSGRGNTKLPGEFRSSQNWIGGTRPENARFVPPPPEQGVATARSILDLFEKDKLRLEELDKVSPALLKIYTDLQRNPLTSAQDIVARAELTMPTANAALKRLEEVGIIEEITGRQRDRVFAYKEYLNLLQ